jgi:hypothetical protein
MKGRQSYLIRLPSLQIVKGNLCLNPAFITLTVIDDKDEHCCNTRGEWEIISMEIGTFHRNTRFFAVVILIITLWLPSRCFSFTNGVKGVVVDGDTGLPIEGVVVVRSWDKVVAGPGGAVSALLTFAEICTNKDGEFVFLPKILPHIGIPLVSWVEENKLIAFKSGYKFLVFDRISSVVTMEKVPESYYLRYEEAQKARENNEIDLHETKLLKEVVELEETFIESLSKFVTGVFFKKNSASDIDFDNAGNVYVADNHGIYKISENGELLEINGRSYQQIRSDYHPVDIEITKDGSFYALSRNIFLKVNIFSKKINETTKQITENTARKTTGTVVEFGGGSRGGHIPPFIQILPKNGGNSDFPRDVDMRFIIGANQKLFLVKENMPFASDRATALYAYDFNGNSFCKYEALHERKNNADIQIIDVASEAGGNILVIYSYVSPIWDSKENKYVYQNGISKIDLNCQKIYDEKIHLTGKARSITSGSNGDIIIADNNSFYVFDKKLRLVFAQNLSESALGEVDITRVKFNKKEKSLYIIEKRYGRILKYALSGKEWYKRKGS